MKKKFNSLKNAPTKLAVSMAVLFSAQANAGLTAEQVTAVTGTIDYGPIVVGVGVIVAAIAIVLVAMKGGKMLLSAVR